MKRKTTVRIEGDRFLVNGSPTYPGTEVEGLLLNSRMVQGIFDDLNPETRRLWDYPDGPWDPERNTREFIEAMPGWRKAGLVGFTINFQGGSPQGYSKAQPWHNSTFREDGSMRPAPLGRMARILDRADELGMVSIVGYFYFGQDERLADEAAVVRAAENATDWLLEGGWTNVLVETANEIDVPRYEHPILAPPRGDEVVRLIQERSAGKVDASAGRLLVSASFGGGRVPTPNLVEAADFVLMHGNGVGHPNRIRAMVREVRAMDAYGGKPILFNEDDHFAFDAEDCNFAAAVSERAGWGLFDWRMPGEGYDEGYQSVPVNWGISSDRKRGFFRMLAHLTGGEAP